MHYIMSELFSFVVYTQLYLNLIVSLYCVHHTSKRLMCNTRLLWRNSQSNKAHRVEPLLSKESALGSNLHALQNAGDQRLYVPSEGRSNDGFLVVKELATYPTHRNFEMDFIRIATYDV